MNHPDPYQPFTHRIAIPEAFLNDVVQPLDKEECQQDATNRESRQDGSNQAGTNQECRDEQHAEKAVDSIGRTAQGRTCQLVGEPDIFRRLETNIQTDFSSHTDSPGKHDRG